MKTKYISIMLFTLVFIGVSLMGQSQVQAQINLGDGICSTQEDDLNLCIRDGCYVIEVKLCDDGTWPCVRTIDGVRYKVFPYRAQIAADVTLPCDCPTWNYTVTQFETCDGVAADTYVTGSSPSGASLVIPNCRVRKCPEATASNEWGDCNAGYEDWKLNPTLNCSEGGSIDFEIRTLPDAGISCGNPTWIINSSGCTAGENLLRGPGCGELLPIATTVSFDGGDATIHVDACTGELTDVTFSNAETVTGMAWICTSNPLNGGDYYDCELSRNAGPWPEGCYVRGSRTYLYGGDAYTTAATEANCTDGVDNDKDRLIDCADPDCSRDPACQ